MTTMIIIMCFGSFLDCITATVHTNSSIILIRESWNPIDTLNLSSNLLSRLGNIFPFILASVIDKNNHGIHLLT